MAQQPIDHGSTAGDGQGESLFSAFQKVNANDVELYGAKTVFVANAAALPVTGEVGKIYITLDDDAMYRWTGTVYDDLGGIQFVANAAALPATGEALKIYIALDTGRFYRWTGAVYVGLGGLVFDIGGNIIANIIPRHDTLANLLITQGGQYEIGVATDQNALVRFSGAAGGVGNIVFRRESYLGSAMMTATANQAVATTATALDLTASVTDDLGAADLTNNWILIPAAAKQIQIFAYGQFAVGAGALRDLRCFIGTYQFSDSCPAHPTVLTKANITTGRLRLADMGITPGVDAITLQAFQDSGAPLNISQVRLSVDFYE